MTPKKSNRKSRKSGDDTQFIKPPISKKKLDNNDIINENYPLFCFKYLSGNSIKNCKDPKFYFDFLMRLQKLSELGWDGIRTSGRHAYGMESIPVKNIKPALPPGITPDVTELHVFRANGNNLPFLGIQVQNIFRIIFIETTFGDIYDH